MKVGDTAPPAQLSKGKVKTIRRRGGGRGRKHWPWLREKVAGGSSLWAGLGDTPHPPGGPSSRGTAVRGHTRWGAQTSRLGPLLQKH